MAAIVRCLPRRCHGNCEPLAGIDEGRIDIRKRHGRFASIQATGIDICGLRARGRGSAPGVAVGERVGRGRLDVDVSGQDAEGDNAVSTGGLGCGQSSGVRQIERHARFWVGAGRAPVVDHDGVGVFGSAQVFLDGDRNIGVIRQLLELEPVATRLVPAFDVDCDRNLGIGGDWRSSFAARIRCAEEPVLAGVSEEIELSFAGWDIRKRDRRAAGDGCGEVGAAFCREEANLRAVVRRLAEVEIVLQGPGGVVELISADVSLHRDAPRAVASRHHRGRNSFDVERNTIQCVPFRNVVGDEVAIVRRKMKGCAIQFSLRWRRIAVGRSSQVAWGCLLRDGHHARGDVLPFEETVRSGVSGELFAVGRGEGEFDVQAGNRATHRERMQRHVSGVVVGWAEEGDHGDGGLGDRNVEELAVQRLSRRNLSGDLLPIGLHKG